MHGEKVKITYCTFIFILHFTREQRTKLTILENPRQVPSLISLQQNQIDALISQIYFGNEIYQQVKGVSMGSPISSAIAEIFLQHLEDIHIKHLLDKKNITFYIRYVDDILMTTNEQTPTSSTNIQTKHTQTLNSTPHIKATDV
jgi:hypothetical protein